MSEKRLALGKKGEDLAAWYLQERGYSIVLRNYRERSGEIDIIARDGKTLVFVEVKTRQTGASYFPAEAVTRRKQAQIGRVAQEYLLRRNLYNEPARFDVVSVSMSPDGKAAIEHIANAFDLPCGGC